MWPRNHKLEVGVICFAAMAFGWEGQAQDLTTRATGCLGSDGNLSRFALGDDPLDDCASGDDQLSFKLDDLSDGAATVPRMARSRCAPAAFSVREPPATDSIWS